jgi:Ca2+-binding EF-hand superfamily protein
LTIKYRQELRSTIFSSLMSVIFMQLSRIADRAIEESDTDGDGCIGYDEFIEAIEKVSVEERLSVRFLL